MEPNDGILHGILQIDDDSEAFLMLVTIMAKEVRREQCDHEQINWQHHVEKRRHTNGFLKRYHIGCSMILLIS